MENSFNEINESSKATEENQFDKIEELLKKYELENIHIDFFEKLSLLFIASLGIITAVSWDQVLKIIVERLFEEVSDVWMKIIYALIVTVLTVLVSILVNKILNKKKDSLNQKNIVQLIRSAIGRNSLKSDHK